MTTKNGISIACLIAAFAGGCRFEIGAESDEKKSCTGAECAAAPTLYGQVRSVSGPVEGAEVDVLEGGVDRRAAVKTDAAGKYRIEALPRGTYSVRVRAKGFVVAIAEVELTQDFVRDFELTSHATAYQNAGLLARGADSDGDLIADSVEATLGTSPSSADSNADGVDDGLAVWVGANPMSGPAPTDQSPVITLPATGFRLPVGAAAPLGLAFGKIPGATGYRVTLTPKGAAQAAFGVDLDAKDNELLLGAGVIAQLVLPAALAAGSYDLVVTGYYGSAANILGTPAKIAIELEASELADVRIEADASRSGVVFARDFEIPAGVTLSVPAGERLIIVASGEVTIAGNLVGQAGAPGGSIAIMAGGDVRVSGSVKAGTGLDGALADGVEAYAHHGAAGGSLHVFGRAGVVIPKSGTLASGAGGRGGAAKAVGTAGTGAGIHAPVATYCMAPSSEGAASCTMLCLELGLGAACASQCETACTTGTFDIDGEHATAIGGDGGPGGALAIFATTIVAAPERGKIFVGNGGDGGDADASGGNAAPDGLGGVAVARSGAGGHSGDVYLSDWNLLDDESQLLPIGDMHYPVAGGSAGQPGESVALAGTNGSDSVMTRQQADPKACECPERSRDGADDVNAPAGKDGGDGWWQPGAGSSVTARGNAGRGCGRGGDAKAQGGKGGSMKNVGIDYEGIGLSVGMPGTGAAGGRAEAKAGNGGEYGVGRGGNAQATGGPGGNGPEPVLGLGAIGDGGPGGAAVAEAGRGYTGYPCCTPPGGAGDGGDGGEAIADAGNGGNANATGGDGGSAYSTPGRGGDGGMGNPAGLAGQAGKSHAQPGNGGKAWAPLLGTDGDPGKKTEGSTTDGHDGQICI